MANRKSFALVSLTLVAILFAGCSLRSGAFVANALEYNLAVEQANNKMLLLNIIRADQRKPMYITDLAKLTGNIKLDLSMGSTVDLGRRKMDIGDKVTPGVDYALNPTFDVNVLATQDFMQGFLSSTSKEIFAFYWEQDWPKDLLLHIFVQRVIEEDITASNPDPKSQKTFSNRPHLDKNGKLIELEEFDRWVNRFLKDDPQFERIPAKVGPCISESSLTSLGDLVAAAKEGLGVAEVEEDRFQLQRSKPDLQFSVREIRQNKRILRNECDAQLGKILECKKSKELQRASADCRPTDSAVCKDLAKDSMLEARVCQNERDKIAAQFHCETACEPIFASADATQIKTASTKPAPEVSAVYEVSENNQTIQRQDTIFLRSPEAIIYYLGQLMRVEEGGQIPKVVIDGQQEPIFVAFKGDKKLGCKKLLQVDYEGEEYIIPNGSGNPDSALACLPGRSMQVLSIVNQLVALQKSAKDFPGTSTVRAIGQ